MGETGVRVSYRLASMASRLWRHGVVVRVFPLMLGASLGCSEKASEGGSGHTTTTAGDTIGPEGGVVTLEGAELTIPAGALSEDVEITMRASDDAPVLADASPASLLYRIGPDDVSLALPATLTIAFVPDSSQTGAATIYTAPTGETADQFLPVTTNPVDSSNVSADIEHFSSWAVFFQNTPGTDCPQEFCGGDPSIECLMCGIPYCVPPGSVCCEAGNVCTPDQPLCTNCPAGEHGGGIIDCAVPGTVCCDGVECPPPNRCTDCHDGQGLVCTTGC